MTVPKHNLTTGSFTGSLTSGFRIESCLATAYRLVRRNGELTLQGCFTWRSDQDVGFEWRDIPTEEQP